MTASSSRLPPQASLSDDEINAFFADIAGSDKATHISLAQLEAKLRSVYNDIAPTPQKHHLHHPTRAQLEGGNGLHAFLVDLLPDLKPEEHGDGNGKRDLDGSFQISKDDFIKEVRGWDVPSPDQSKATDDEQEAHEYERKLPWTRKVAAHWSVEGPGYLFIALVVALQVAFGAWQGAIYVQNQPVRRALGWGVICAKFSAGALYPTLFFMLLSMSRWVATLLRKSYTLSKFVNIDFHQSFHVCMSIVGLLLASVHAIGHLTGTFLYSSRPAQADDVIAIDKPVRSYRDYVRTLPGWSGIVALSLFWTIAALSAPAVRRWNFEVFQVGHLLMFPMIGLLAAHGTAMLLQYPMLGFWLVAPTLIVLAERGLRLVRTFRHIPARLAVLDDETVRICVRHPRGKDWSYQAGQYILLAVPRLSYFQWHPFTISACVDDCLQVHIKTSGDWTSALRDLALDMGTETDITVAIDGPLGAPATRFYDYKRSIVVGSGIGITPFAAVLTDLEQKALQEGINPWREKRRPSFSRVLSRTASIPSQVVTRVRSRSSSFSGRRQSLEGEESGGGGEQRGSGLISAAAIREAKARAAKRRSGIASAPEDAADEDDGAATVVGNGSSPGAEAQDKEKPSPTQDKFAPDQSGRRRRVDFVWLVRDRNHLLWFADLLNRLSDYAESHAKQEQDGLAGSPVIRATPAAPSSASASSTPPPPIELRINTFITAKRKAISTHVFRVLLDRYRTDACPVSALTGLRVTSRFGRPDLQGMLRAFYEDLRREGFEGEAGVFFCGAPAIGRLLADQCNELTARSRAEGGKVRFHFLNEVFG